MINFLSNLFTNIVFAQSAVTNVATLMYKINKLIINPLIIFIFALTFAYFMWGVIGFITHAGDPEKRKTGRDHIMWGLIGMLIMIGVFFIMELIMKTLGVSGINPAGGPVNIR